MNSAQENGNKKKTLPLKVDEVSEVPSTWEISNKCRSVAAAAVEMKADSQVLRLHPSQRPSLPSVSHSLGPMCAAHLQPVEALELLNKMSLCEWKSKMEFVLLRKWNHSVGSDSLQPHLLCNSPWNSPGQNTRVGSRSPSPGDLPNPGTEPKSPALQTDSLPAELWGKLRVLWYGTRRPLRKCGLGTSQPRWNLTFGLDKVIQNICQKLMTSYLLIRPLL